MINFTKDFRTIRRFLSKSIREKLPDDAKIIEVSVGESRRLNRIYLKKHKATNVLSFRYGPGYGEIVLCPALIRREAKASGTSYRCQMLWMILHGTIHLAGLHHEKSKRAERRVAQLEKKILKKIKPCPVIQPRMVLHAKG